MGTRSTVKGYWRQGGDSTSNLPTPAVMPSIIEISFDSALADTTLTGIWLPKGAVIMSIDQDGGATGGTVPLVNIGVATATPDVDAIINGAAMTSAGRLLASTATVPGVMFVKATALSASAEITAGDDGSGTPSTGTVIAIITYYLSDDGVHNN